MSLPDGVQILSMTTHVERVVIPVDGEVKIECPSNVVERVLYSVVCPPETKSPLDVLAYLEDCLIFQAPAEFLARGGIWSPKDIPYTAMYGFEGFDRACSSLLLSAINEDEIVDTRLFKAIQLAQVAFEKCAMRSIGTLLYPQILRPEMAPLLLSLTMPVHRPAPLPDYAFLPVACDLVMTEKRPLEPAK